MRCAKAMVLMDVFDKFESNHPIYVYCMLDECFVKNENVCGGECDGYNYDDNRAELFKQKIAKIVDKDE